MIRVAAATPAVDLAWHAFDQAMLDLHDMYARQSADADTRRAKALATARLWIAFRDLMATVPAGTMPPAAA